MDCTICGAWRREERHKMPDVVRSCEIKAKLPKKIGNVRGGLCRIHISITSRRAASHGIRKWVSDTSWEWNRKVGGVRQHIAIDGSLKRIRGRDAACGCAVLLAELELESTIKETNLCAFAKALAGLIGPSTLHTDDTGICGDVKKDALGQRKTMRNYG